ncbi:MAG: restriction endonuclease [Chlorobi bacterium]|nr:restriction endonuclease [Chlorobiota bacterium]MCI0716930.1 restriction endonuclease [Chlorobiota bacterium]
MKKSHQLKTGSIYCGDCLKMLDEIPDESIDLIYIDPPFNSNRNYETFWGDVQEKRAFTDRFGDADAYIRYMRPRVEKLYRVLKKTGSFYYHCDWHASHYVKIMLDEIFSFNNFKNEIVWKRTSAHNDPKQYGRNSDRIFFYTKSDKYTFHPQYTEYEEEYLNNFYRFKDKRGRYRLSDLTGAGVTKGDSNIEWKGYKPSTRKRHWAVPNWAVQKLIDKEVAELTIREKLEVLYENGFIEISKNGVPSFKRYLEEMKGAPLQEIWTDIPPISAQAKERLGYPTQKPMALMERIISSSSNKGDVVLDAFCGCGTTLVASQKLGRKWIGIDVSPTACRVMSQRLWDDFKLVEGKDFELVDIRKTEAELRIMPHFEFQNWAVIALGQLTDMSGIPNKRKSGDFGIDGRLYPIELEKKKKAGEDLFGDVDRYYPVQVKQMDKVGRPDIDNFYAAMKRDGRDKGYFIAFGFSGEAEKEVKRLYKTGDADINLVTVKKLLEMEANLL